MQLLTHETQQNTTKNDSKLQTPHSADAPLRANWPRWQHKDWSLQANTSQRSPKTGYQQSKSGQQKFPSTTPLIRWALQNGLTSTAVVCWVLAAAVGPKRCLWEEIFAPFALLCHVLCRSCIWLADGAGFCLIRRAAVVVWLKIL